MPKSAFWKLFSVQIFLGAGRKKTFLGQLATVKNEGYNTYQQKRNRGIQNQLESKRFLNGLISSLPSKTINLLQRTWQWFSTHRKSSKKSEDHILKIIFHAYLLIFLAKRFYELDLFKSSIVLLLKDCYFQENGVKKNYFSIYYISLSRQKMLALILNFLVYV